MKLSQNEMKQICALAAMSEEQFIAANAAWIQGDKTFSDEIFLSEFDKRITANCE